MLVVIEGATGTGKSTIAGSLAERHNAEVVHRLQPKGRHPLDWFTEFVCDYRPGSGWNLVLDRWHLSEWVYGPALRGRTDLTPSAFMAVDEMLKDKGALLVYTSAFVRHAQAAMFARDGRYRFTDNEVLTHMRRFEDALSLTTIPRMSYRFQPEPMAPIWGVENIADFALKLEREVTA